MTQQKRPPAQKTDDVLRRMLSTPPTQHAPAKKPAKKKSAK